MSRDYSYATISLVRVARGKNRVYLIYTPPPGVGTVNYFATKYTSAALCSLPDAVMIVFFFVKNPIIRPICSGRRTNGTNRQSHVAFTQIERNVDFISTMKTRLPGRGGGLCIVPPPSKIELLAINGGRRRRPYTRYRVREIYGTQRTDGLGSVPVRPFFRRRRRYPRRRSPRKTR